jgi:hypothetical protein
MVGLIQSVLKFVVWLEVTFISLSLRFFFYYKYKFSLHLLINSCLHVRLKFDCFCLSSADLNGDGEVEIVASTTVTSPYNQLFVLSPSGTLYQPPGGHNPAWPRYNSLTGPGNDADVNCAGQTGYGTLLSTSFLFFLFLQFTLL